MKITSYDKIRRLAKTSRYQTLYSQSKELHLQLFDNISRLSDLQIEFLNWLGFYANLYLELALGEITDIVFEDEIYEDAYSYYKRHKDKKDRTALDKQSKMPLDSKSSNKGGNINWIFKNPQRK